MLALTTAWASPLHASEVPLVFAAASLKTVLDDLAQLVPMRLSYGGSGALARQITLGAPADLFISANPQWMDVIEEKEFLQGEAIALVQGELVLVSSKDAPDRTLDSLPGQGRIAMGFVNAVPAGQYGKAAFEVLGIWEKIASQVVQTENVRAALALVARGEVPWGVVYATDALAEPGVRIVARFEASLHPEIRYEAGLIKGSRHQLTLNALTMPESSAVFARHGFKVL